MTCSDCIHYKECFERRGACKEYKTLEEIRKEIESVNQSQKPAVRTETDKAVHEHGISGLSRRVRTQEADENSKCDQPAEGDHSAVQDQKS